MLVVNIGLLIIAIITVYITGLQYRASHAPVLTVTRSGYKISRKIDDNYYRVTVENRGNGVCLDAFLLIKKKMKVNKYYLSKPVRGIEQNEEKELYVYVNRVGDSTRLKGVKFLVVYMDNFGQKYLANDVLEGEMYKGQKISNEHLERFAKPAILLSWWRVKTWVYKYWMKKAIKQRNTFSGIEKKKEKKNFD